MGFHYVFPIDFWFLWLAKVQARTKWGVCLKSQDLTMRRAKGRSWLAVDIPGVGLTSPLLPTAFRPPLVEAGTTGAGGKIHMEVVPGRDRAAQESELKTTVFQTRAVVAVAFALQLIKYVETGSVLLKQNMLKHCWNNTKVRAWLPGNCHHLTIFHPLPETHRSLNHPKHHCNETSQLDTWTGRVLCLRVLALKLRIQQMVLGQPDFDPRVCSCNGAVHLIQLMWAACQELTERFCLTSCFWFFWSCLASCRFLKLPSWGVSRSRQELLSVMQRSDISAAWLNRTAKPQTSMGK